MLLAAASFTAAMTKRIRIPYSIALVFVGLILGFLNLVPDELHLREELVFVLFLPPLLFEATLHIQFHTLRKRAKIISMLAVFGVILSTFVVAWLITLITHLDFATALLFGAVISATDPISVLAIFKQLGVSRNLSILVDGESLFNDGTAVVIYNIVRAIVIGHVAFSLQFAIVEFVKVAVGGIILGFALGIIFSKIFELVDDHLIEITITTILVFGGFALAEFWHVSGVITVVVSGLVIGNYGVKKGMSSTTQVAVHSFWEYIAFAVNSVIFILVGREVVDILGNPDRLQLNLFIVVAAFVIVLFARALAVFPIAAIANALRERIASREQVVLFWGGLRGSLPMALVLGLPSDLPERDTILVITFGVVFISLVLQGMTIKPLLRRFGLAFTKSEEQIRYDHLLGEFISAQSAITQLEYLFEKQHMPLSIFEEKIERWRNKVEVLSLEIDNLIGENPELTAKQRARINLTIMHAQRAALSRATIDEILSPEVAEELQSEINAEILDLNEKER